jgi:HrpA-like RNA helicase
MSSIALLLRATLVVHQQPEVIAYGDARSAKDAEKVAALHALLLLVERRLLGSRPPPGVAKAAAASSGAAAAAAQPTVQLSDKTMLTAERAREFMEYYCKKFNFGKPDILLSQGTQQKGRRQVQAGWEAEMAVGGRRIGMAQGSNKKVATSNVYLDTVKYLESCDPELWRQFDMTHKPGAPVGSAPHVYFRISDELDDELRAVYQDTRQSMLYAKRPRLAGVAQPGEARSELVAQKPRDQRRFGGPGAASEEVLKQKSARLLADLDAYQTADRVKAIREQRHSLPVQQKAGDVLVKIELNQVTIVMAATGSGKTTQIPQMLFDDYILRGEGAKCNIFCTQPRRIAAISVAQRVAKERGERVGETVGYQVRFEAKTPQPNGSITFCTTGVFLRRLQSALGDSNASNSFLDSLTHIVVDEVHERDVETDLLLVVIKRLLAERKRMGKKEIKLVLMSATIDPTLFQNYFTEPPPSLKPAPVVEVPGRSFPVDKHYLEETIAHLQSQRLTHRDGAWVFQEKNVRDYLERELNQGGGIVKRVINGAPGAEAEASDAIDDLELPYPLISLMIADVINRSDDGHVLVFMPGWEEIKAVNTILQDTRSRPLLGLDFNDSSRFEVHILHSSIPVAEQQAVFDPPRDPSIRRIILSTNIAETSVTIPDVVYVVDTGRVKEKRYDPERHLSSLVSAWVGTSNLNQRAGRAGRHRPGEYYGVLSKARYDQLNVNQTVEMKRTDLSNVVMHIKALDIPGMEVEDVLDAAIEPPAPERVRAAMEKLFMVGALDQSKALTSLGHVLLQLPVDAAMGKMCLYGAFFRCLDPTLTLAAVLTNRDPFMAPMALKREADAVKDSWCPPDFRSDALTVLRAYTHWWDMQGRGDYQAANRFCSDNFLSKITLLQIQQVKEHLFSSLEKAGIIDVTLGSAASARAPAPRAHGVPTGPASRMRSHLTETSPELNVNSGSTPLLAALIALASTPNFAIRSSEKVFRTSQDKVRCAETAGSCA